jgi:putative alpha-1,2-mannosidase
MKKNILLVAPLLLLFCRTVNGQQGKDYTQYVNAFIGTGGHGHTFPGACVPNGLVQMSPTTDTEGWDWASGYHYNDSTVLGFSHTHLSGTGVGDLGNLLLIPRIGEVIVTPKPCRTT